MNKNFTCKEGVDIEDFQYMSPYLMSMFSYFLGYCLQHNLPCVITSIKDEAKGRVSKTHEQGRAFDASVRGWSEFHIQRVIHLMNNKFKHIAAISASDGQPRAIVYHKVKGNAWHFHAQVRRFSEADKID